MREAKFKYWVVVERMFEDNESFFETIHCRGSMNLAKRKFDKAKEKANFEIKEGFCVKCVLSMIRTLDNVDLRSITDRATLKRIIEDNEISGCTISLKEV